MATRIIDAVVAGPGADSTSTPAIAYQLLLAFPRKNWSAWPSQLPSICASEGAERCKISGEPATITAGTSVNAGFCADAAETRVDKSTNARKPGTDRIHTAYW